MQNALKWIVAGIIAGGAVYMIAKGALTSSEGKFVGVFPEKDGFGADDIAKGVVIIGVAAIGGALVHKFGGPAPVARLAA